MIKWFFRLFVLLLLVLIIGGVYLFGTYHVIKTKDGYHLVRKPKFELTSVVDTTSWGVTDYLKNTEITRALGEIRWKNFTEKAGNLWDDLSNNIDRFVEKHEEDFRGEDLRASIDDLRRQAKKRYENLKEKFEAGEFDSGAFKQRLKDLGAWLEEQLEGLRARLGG